LEDEIAVGISDGKSDGVEDDVISVGNTVGVCEYVVNDGIAVGFRNRFTEGVVDG